jgi:hypothetical protein
MGVHYRQFRTKRIWKLRAHGLGIQIQRLVKLCNESEMSVLDPYRPKLDY